MILSSLSEVDAAAVAAVAFRSRSCSQRAVAIAAEAGVEASAVVEAAEVWRLWRRRWL
jgi:hypothetical protein